MADRLSYPGTPRWVKVFGIITIGLVLLFVTMPSPALVVPRALFATFRPVTLVAAHCPPALHNTACNSP